MRHTGIVLVTGLVAVLALAGCTQPQQGAAPPTAPTPEVQQQSSTPSAPPAAAATVPVAAVPVEKPVPPEESPPGDIPDDTQFVAFRPAGSHLLFKVPEGWAQRNMPSAVEFSDKLNTVILKWGPATAAPSVASARTAGVAALKLTEPAFQLVGVKKVSLPGGPAVVIQYRSNSKPNPVTGKRYRLDVLRFESFKNGTEADLILSSPVGADNVDPWRLISESLRWQ